MATLTMMQFLDALRNLLDADALREAETLAQEFPEPRRLAAELVRRGRLTQGQADALLAEDAGQITAEPPMPRPPADTTHRERERDISRPARGNSGVVILIVALVALVVCVPVLGLVGFFLLGVGAFFMAANEGAGRAPNLAAPAEAPHEAAQKLVVGDAVAVAPGAQNLEIVKRFDGNRFFLSLDGTQIAHGSNGKYSVSGLDNDKKFFDLREGRTPLGFTRDKPPEIASGSSGESMTVFLNDAETGQELKICPAVRGPITMTRLAPDGEFALILCGSDLVLYKFAALKEAPVHLTLDDDVTDLAIANDGATFLVGTDSGKVQLWSLGKREKIRDYPGAIFGITCVAFSPDGTRVLAGCEQSVLVWERDEPEKRLTFDQDDAVLCAAFSPDSKKILTGGKRGLVCVSNAATGAMIGQFRHGVAMTAVAFHPDGRRGITASTDNVVRVWNLPK